MDMQQVLNSPLWQTIAALVSIMTGLALIILFFRNPQRPSKEKLWITIMVTLVSLVVVGLSGWGIGALSHSEAVQTPTPCPHPFAQDVMHASSTTALSWFQPCGWTASHVILHYTIDSGMQQNIYMTYTKNTSRWEYTISDIHSGQLLTYSYTYQPSMGDQKDTPRYYWTGGS